MTNEDSGHQVKTQVMVALFLGICWPICWFFFITAMKFKSNLFGYQILMIIIIKCIVGHWCFLCLVIVYINILHVRTTVTGMIFGCLITQLLGNNKTVFCLLQIPAYWLKWALSHFVQLYCKTFPFKGSNQINWTAFKVICPFSLNKCHRLYTDSL